MSLVAAIEISSDEIVIVTAEATSLDEIKLIDVFKIPRKSLRPRVLEDEEGQSIQVNEELSSSSARNFAVDEAAQNFSEGTLPEGSTKVQKVTSYTSAGEIDQSIIEERNRYFRDFFLNNVDYTFAVITNPYILYQTSESPFSDQKKISKIVPTQLQDALPFPIDNFVIDSKVFQQNSSSKLFTICSALLPKEILEEALADLAELNADPEFITTPANSLVLLKSFLPEKFQGDFVIVDCQEEHFSMAIYVANKLTHLREFPLQASYTDIRCSIARIEADFQIVFSQYYAVGDILRVDSLAQLLGINFERLDFEEAVQKTEFVGIDANNLSWAISLIGYGTQRPRKGTAEPFDFRQGPYSYKPIYRNVISLVQENSFILVATALLFFLLFFSKLYLSYSSISKIDNIISTKLSEAFPGETVARKEEISFLESKVSSLEEQMKGLGNMSALSPLEILKQLSETINASVEITIDKVNISSDKITLSGSGANKVAVSKIDTVLKAQKKNFCKIDVNPREGQGDGTSPSRENFDVTIELCQ